MDNVGEMDKFLERCNLSGLNQKDIENMNRPITSNEIDICDLCQKSVMKNLPTEASLAAQW